MATVTKKELAYRISEKTGLKKVVIKRVIQCFIDEIIDELAAGNRLEFREFGVFETKTRAARKARNPRTGGPGRRAEQGGRALQGRTHDEVARAVTVRRRLRRDDGRRCRADSCDDAVSADIVSPRRCSGLYGTRVFRHLSSASCSFYPNYPSMLRMTS